MKWAVKTKENESHAKRTKIWEEKIDSSRLVLYMMRVR